MSERLKEGAELFERLELSDLRVGDLLVITTGTEDEAWNYDFTVTEPDKEWPMGEFGAVDPKGVRIEAVSFRIHGSGRWTTRRQNPVQTQERALTVSWGSIHLGAFLVGHFDGHKDRAVFERKGQEISQIALHRQA